MFDSWKLWDYAPGEGVSLGVFGEQFDVDDWIDVEVPGDVHRALIAAGRIPDPFYDRNVQCSTTRTRLPHRPFALDPARELPGICRV